ncbi:glycosyltransferase [Patescibacteria group bacterium]|nr:glycosyltransferase [Patescibacteria group bacterium]
MEKVTVEGTVGSVEDYISLVGPELVEEVKELARPLKGARIILLNSTAVGGGVAEMFPGFIRLLHSLGIEVTWLVMPGNRQFFAVTKKIHNGLQGADISLTEAERSIYSRQNEITGKELAQYAADLYEIHDPQPAGVYPYLSDRPALWRCHIDSSTANPEFWEFIRERIEPYDRLIFSMQEFARKDLDSRKVVIIHPAIDPFSVKNRQMDQETAKRTIARYGINPNAPLMTQISRFDPWKDPVGVIEAYRLARRRHPDLQLVLLGAMADDDPEGPTILASLRQAVGNDQSVHILADTSPNDREVNAFQTLSRVIVQKSLREGFGLTVTEALWKGQPVVAGNVGGIRAQIRNGQNGFLVDTVEECAERVEYLLDNPDQQRELGRQARETVRQKFLMIRLVRDHLKLYRQLLGKQQLQPVMMTE